MLAPVLQNLVQKVELRPVPLSPSCQIVNLALYPVAVLTKDRTDSTRLVVVVKTRRYHAQVNLTEPALILLGSGNRIP